MYAGGHVDKELVHGEQRTRRNPVLRQREYRDSDREIIDAEGG